MTPAADDITAHYERHAIAWDADRRTSGWNDKRWHERFIEVLGYEIVIQEMQRHRVSMISNFFAEPMVNLLVWGLIRRWSILNRFLFSNGRAHAPLD
jgi:hypothetical protein